MKLTKDAKAFREARRALKKSKRFDNLDRIWKCVVVAAAVAAGGTNETVYKGRPTQLLTREAFHEMKMDYKKTRQRIVTHPFQPTGKKYAYHPPSLSSELNPEFVKPNAYELANAKSNMQREYDDLIASCKDTKDFALHADRIKELESLLA